MAPKKTVETLQSLSQQVVTSSLRSAFRKLSLQDSDKEHVTELKSYFHEYPVTIIDDVANDLFEDTSKNEIEVITRITLTLKILCRNPQRLTLYLYMYSSRWNTPVYFAF